MLYNCLWTGVTIDEFAEIPDQDVHWYAEKNQGISWWFESFTQEAVA